MPKRSRERTALHGRSETLRHPAQDSNPNVFCSATCGRLLTNGRTSVMAEPGPFVRRRGEVGRSAHQAHEPVLRAQGGEYREEIVHRAMTKWVDAGVENPCIDKDCNYAFPPMN